MGADWLEAKGLRILERNFRCKVGEIDIIGEMNDSLVFVEVRVRSSDSRGLPAESVNYKKQQRLRRIATWYISQKKKAEEACRFDVLGILYDRHRGVSDIQWYQDAF